MLINQKGQALLIVVLVMVVALTVGLSVASRSITNLKTSQDQADSQKALAAAEAGVERVLSDPTLTNPLTKISIGDAVYNVNYTTTVVQSSGIDKYLLNGGFQIAKNDHVSIWPAKSSDTDLWTNPWNGQIILYWGSDPDGCNDPALEVSILSGTVNDPILTRYAYDPCDTLRRTGAAASNNFLQVTKNPTQVGSQMLQYQVSVPKVPNTLLISISPLYFGNVYIGAQATGSPLPTQGKNISSTGTVQDQVERRVNAFKDLPQIPAELFPYTIFSP